MKYAIIGGGASGLTASIKLAKIGSVTIFERNSKLGKKLLLTGNGKCNLGNTNNSIDKYHTSNMDDIKMIITKDNIDLVHNFLRDIGLILKDKGGYLYPYSEKASSVLSCLENAALSLGVKIKCDTYIESIEKINDKFLVNGEVFDALVMATGGLSYPKTGSDGNAFKMIQDNHLINKTYPSLVALKTNLGIEKNLKGIRASAKCSLVVDGEVLKEEVGEVQFTDLGLSGICIFNLSRDVSFFLEQKKEVCIKLNLLPFLDGDVLGFLSNKMRKLSVVADGFLDYKLSNELFKYYHINYKLPVGKLSHDEILKVKEILTNLTFRVYDTYGFSSSQVTRGGVSLDSIDLKTFESKKVKNLYIIGEALDLDGDCGGYNLTIAFLTGLLCGGSNDKNK